MNLSKENGNCLKGICALMVLICHTCSQSGFLMLPGVGVGAVITAFGYWGVSVFFFLSGYGLVKKFATSVGGGI